MANNNEKQMSYLSKSAFRKSVPILKRRNPIPQSMKDAPYHALVGAVLHGKSPNMPTETNNRYVRSQAGLTNRWRMPDPLYNDLLGSNQALKAINIPFNIALVNRLRKNYPTMNPLLLVCKDFAEVDDEHNWSILRNQTPTCPKSEDEDRLPPI